MGQDQARLPRGCRLRPRGPQGRAWWVPSAGADCPAPPSICPGQTLPTPGLAAVGQATRLRAETVFCSVLFPGGWSILREQWRVSLFFCGLLSNTQHSILCLVDA